MWRETLRKTMRLGYFLSSEAYQGPIAVNVIPRDVSNCLYIVKTEVPFADELFMEDSQYIHYVGLTRISLRKRLRQHIFTRSRLGCFILNNPHSRDDWPIEIIIIRGDLVAAEKETIKALRPILNIQHNP